MRRQVYVKFAEALQARALERQAYDAADAIIAKIAECGMEKDAGLKDGVRAVRNLLAAGILALTPAAKGGVEVAHALPKAAPAIERFVDVAKAMPEVASGTAKTVIRAAKPAKREIAAVVRNAVKEPISAAYGNGPIPPGKTDWRRILKWLGVGTAAVGTAGGGIYAYNRNK